MPWLPLWLWVIWYENNKRNNEDDDSYFVLFDLDWTIKDIIVIIIPTIIMIAVAIIGYLWAFGYIAF